MKISKEKLIEDLKDTESNDFSGLVSVIFAKHCVTAKVIDDNNDEFDADIMFDDDFEDACNDLLEKIINFIDNAKS